MDIYEDVREKERRDTSPNHHAAVRHLCAKDDRFHDLHTKYVCIYICIYLVHLHKHFDQAPTSDIFLFRV